MRRTLSSVIFAAAALVATLALGQAKRGGNRAPRKSVTGASVRDLPAPSPPDNPYDEARGSKATDAGTRPPSSFSDAASAPGGEVADNGDPSGASGEAGNRDEPVRASPLNPKSEELPEGGGMESSPPDIGALLGEIASLRARVAAVSDALFHSRLLLRVEMRGAHARLAKLIVSLDDGLIYTAPPNFRAEDETVVYDHAVAPGRHMLGFEVERRDDRGDTFRNAQASRVAIEVPENDRLEATIRIDDDSDMGADFPSSKKGTYDLRLRVSARARH
jgi:hypothetical protein